MVHGIMVTISSAELQKNFGRYKEAAQREPIRVTSHGRESLVMLSAEEYRRLAALDTRRAYHPADLPPELRDALEAARPPAEAARFDGEVEG